MNSIETFNLTKVYSSGLKKNEVRALTDLNIKVDQGTIYGLLGPNGAGKTTLVKLLLGITFPTSGSAKILEHEINDYQIKSQIGYLPENHKYPSYLTGGEVLHFFGKLSGMENTLLKSRIDEMLSLVNMSKWKKTKIKNYSKGMMQRLGLAQAMINDPQLIFLDEPTDGVDPIGRKEIRDVLMHLKEKSKTIFLNSHLLSEVELITDRVGILNKGKLIKEGTVKEITEKQEEYKISVENFKLEDLSSEELVGVSYQSLHNGDYILKIDDKSALNKLLDILRNKGAVINEMTKQKNTLEDMFISLIQESEKENVG